MNTVIVMGRDTKDGEIRYSQSGTAIYRNSVAVERRFKKEGQPEADFFDFVAFNKTAEWAEKYLKKGTKVVISGEIRNDNYTNKEGQKVYRTVILANSIEFAESKKAAEGGTASEKETSAEKTPAKKAPTKKKAPTPVAAEPVTDSDGFMTIPDGVDDELPFA